MKGYTDIHSHLLYGIDDGAKTRDDMEAMLDAAYADGITSIFATPHVTPGVYPLPTEQIAQRLDEARAYCRMKGYKLDISAGAEILFTPALERFAQEGRLPALGDTRHILVEFMPDIGYAELSAAVGMMERAGYGVIIAHIERYDCLRRRGNVFRLKDSCDVRYQVNCQSLLKKQGFFRERFLKQCLKLELIDGVATDAHDCIRRPCRMEKAHSLLAQRYGQEYASRLTCGDILNPHDA